MLSQLKRKSPPGWVLAEMEHSKAGRVQGCKAEQAETPNDQVSRDYASGIRRLQP